MLQHIRCCQEAVTCTNVTPSLLKLQLFTHSKSYSEQGFRARIVESTSSIWGIAEDWMGHVFLVHTFKNSWQQSAKKAESKLNYDLTDNLMARELLATNPSPFQLSARATCEPWGLQTALAAAGTRCRATCGAWWCVLQSYLTPEPAAPPECGATCCSVSIALVQRGSV